MSKSNFSLLHEILSALLLFFTPYDEIFEALSDLDKAPSLVKKLSGQHTACQTVLLALITMYYKGDRTAALFFAVAVLLVTFNISMIYDKVDTDTFNTQATKIGAPAYACLNALPIVIVEGMLIFELYIVAPKGFCVVLGILGMLLGAVCGLYWIWSGRYGSGKSISTA